MSAAQQQQADELWTVKDVMKFTRRCRRWVYAHADELGAIRSFGGVRFDPAIIRARATPAAKVLPFHLPKPKPR